MAEEKSATVSEVVPAAAATEVSTSVTPAAAEVTVEEKAAAIQPTTAEAETTPVSEEPKKEDEAAAAADEAAAAEVDPATLNSVSFKEESNVVADLPDPEKVALDELKKLIQDALANNAFTPPPPVPEAPPAKPEEPTEAAAEEPPKSEDPVAAEASAEEPTKTEAAEEPVKTEEAKPTEPASPVVVETVVAAVEAKPTEPASPVVVETVVAAVEASASASAVAEPAVEASAVTEPTEPPQEEKKVVVDEDGAKTVEAIEETIVPAATTPPAEEAIPASDAPVESATPQEEVLIWGVPLLGDEKSDTVLLKFLRARDFKPKDALAMIKHAVIWRKQFGIDDLLAEELGVAPELGEKVVFMHGSDKEGHPVCYNVYGEFQDKELYAKAFGDEEKREKFLKWRIQFLEKGIREMLDFSPGSVCTMVQVTDLKNLPGPGKRELRQATSKALTLLQDSYPEFVAKQIFINVPWWYLAYYRTIGSIFTQRSKSKFVFAGPSSSTDTLFKYIAPEQVPVQYGGLSKEDEDFSTADAVTEVTIKPSSKHTVEIPVTEGTTLVWEFRVLGWEVSYGAEFVPSAEGGYTVIIAKAKKFAVTDEAVVKNSFKISEPGTVVLTIDNASSKKKKILYRSKVKSAPEST